MMIKILLCLLLAPLLYADSDITEFKVETRPKEHIDAYDFPGTYAQLKEIDIDATRQMRVTMDLPGEYPVLKRINYEGSFGTFRGTLSGHFPQLEEITFLCSSTAIKLDLNAHWEKSCTICVKEGRGNVELILPRDVGVTVETKVSLKGKVVNTFLEKKGRGFLKKNYYNPEQANNPIQITLQIEMGDGRLVLS